MISHKYRCIFIHIPKTAGTSIENKLGLFDKLDRRVQDHRILREIEPLRVQNLLFPLRPDNVEILLRKMRNKLRKDPVVSQQQYKTYFKFTIVRNSWSRAFSWYNNIMRDEFQREKMGIPADCSLRQFLIDYPNQWALRSQLHWLTDHKGSIPIDYVGRFETLSEDFAHICTVLCIEDSVLPKLISGDTSSYVDAYDDQTRELVAQRYKDEISRFNFEFGK